jgi:hypothetical protein
MKFNSDHSKAWAKYFGGTLDEILRSVSIDSSEASVFAGGHAESTGFTNGGKDMLFVKLSASTGSISFVKHYGGTGYDSLYMISINGSGLYFTGMSDSVGWRSGQSDIIIGKLNTSNGSKVWVRSIGS